MKNRLRSGSSEEREGGFTLIELLVVIIIIGILAAIAIPVFLNQRKKAVDASMKSDLRTVANEEETYFTDFQSYKAVAASTASMVIGADTVTLSTGNTVTVILNTAGTAYCISATNPKGTKTRPWPATVSAGGTCDLRDAGQPVLLTGPDTAVGRVIQTHPDRSSAGLLRRSVIAVRPKGLPIPSPTACKGG